MDTKSTKSAIKDKWFVIPVILLLVYFLIRFIDAIQIVYYFPINNLGNDYSGHVIRLHFLKEYGFHNIVPNWFNGFPILKSYPFFWYFFALPIAYLIDNVQIALLIAFAITYLLVLWILFLIGKKEKFSKVQVIVFFTFLFANPITISYFLRLGKVVELLGWFFFFILFLLFLYYKEKNLDKSFIFLFTIIYASIFYTHILVFIVSTLMVFSFFIFKRDLSQKIKIFFGSLFTLIITSYFWYPLLKNLNERAISTTLPLKWLVINKPEYFSDKIMAFIIPIVFWIILYFYCTTSENKKKELLFFSVPFIFSIVYFLRIAPFIPFINRPTPDSYNFFFMFISIYMLLKIDFSFLNKNLIKVVPYTLVLLSLLFIFISMTSTPFFTKSTQEGEDAIKLLPYLKDKFMVINPNFHKGTFYAYSALFFNSSTPDGWVEEEIPLSYINMLTDIQDNFNSGKCDEVNNALKRLNNRYLMLFNNNCDDIKCNYKIQKRVNTACLVAID
ncbi:hypothetical protein HYX18_01475 [Candidatus Woesearchaeota archaeon]|nr:hypothetical protein [Candidatus Woesearchaeota archaeon]